MDTESGVAEAFLGGFEQASSITDEEAQNRIDLTVTPKNKKWNDTLQEFQKLLADTDMTIGQILSDKFTTHEARLFTSSESATLKGIQEDNTLRFHKFLQTRFQGVTPDIPTKLTMLYFGFPVEPIDFSLAEMTFKMESRKPEPPRYAIDPPLHFLTAHKERNWGNEIVIGKEDPSYPIAVELPQSWLSRLSNTYLKGQLVLEEQNVPIKQSAARLRGGGASDDSDWSEENDNWGEENDNDFAYSESDGEDGDEDSDYEDDTSENQFHREEKQTEDVTMEGIDNDGDFISNDQSASTPQSTKWMRLYGFQGYVPFIPGDGRTYETAIRRLLSLGPRDHKAFSIVHFDEQSNLVDTVQDSLPLNPDSITLQYIMEKRLEEGSSLDNQHSFFVHLKHESTPKHWRPSEKQFDTSVSSVRCPLDGADGKAADDPVSCCYLTFPKFNGSQSSQQDVYGWGADQLNAYINTAFEVLLGRPEDSFHHAYFQLGRSDSDFLNAPPVYGLYTAASSDILSLIPSGDGKHFYLRRSRLGNNEVAIVLPGCFNTSSPTSEWSGEITMTNVLDPMRNMVSLAFGDYTKHLKYVRLLDGRATLGPEINRNQEYYSICMSDDIPQNPESDYSSALSKIAATANPFVLLYPEWEEDRNVLHLSTFDGEDGTEHCVHMPSLSSTVDEFRASVFELMRLAECEPSRIEDVKRGDAFISVQPEMENQSSDTSIDMPCFFIGPNTTDEEWFGIRARITTPSAKIKIFDSKIWNWRDQVDSTDIWGPRYGLVAGVQAAIKKLENKDTREQEKEDALQDKAEETAQETTQMPVLTSPVGVEALRAVLREKEPVQATHAEPVKTQRPGRVAPSGGDVRQKAWAQQPSIFDNYGLRPWPNNSGIQFPMNAPPVEHMLRTGPRMPMVSKGILTPTEQVNLQRAVWDLRGICLNRTNPSLQNGFSVPDQHTMKSQPESFDKVRRCTFCNEILPVHWNTQQIHRHLREKHRDELMEALGVSKATIRRFNGRGVISIPLKKAKRRHSPSPIALANDEMIVDEPEAQKYHHKDAFGFCDRCGRDGNYHNSSERAHHDTHCKPGIFNGANCAFCTTCGETIWHSTTDARKSRKSSGQLTHCSHNVDDTEGPHCSDCGFDTSRLPQDGRDQHRKECKGFGAVSGRFCLYCGEEFRDNATQADWDRNRAHMVACYEENQGTKSLLLPPDTAAYYQQENNLCMQVNQQIFSTIDSHEGKTVPENEALQSINPEGEQNSEEMDLDDSDEESTRAKPTKRFHMGRLSQEMTDPPIDDIFGTALQEAMGRAGVGRKTSQIEALDPDAHRHNQEALRAVLLRSIINSPFDELNAASPSMTQSEPLSLPASSDPLVPESEEEHEVSQLETRKIAESPELEDPESSESEPDNGSDFENEPDQDKSGEEESDDDPQGDPSSSKRRKIGGKKRGKKGDRNYTFSDDEDDDEDSESDADGKRVRPPRRPPSPNWKRVLGPDDPEFEPTDDFYCSKCFRKAPKKHKRDRSPLGRTKEIELHYDSSRCCGIRRGIGSTKRLPNRSGWIPSADMPKPLGNLRKQFLRRYPAYSRTLYPLNASNANGSYYRSDPNNDENKGCWDIPWPPFRGPTPLPNGWDAPDVVNAPVTGKARKQFKLRSEGDSTYVQEKNIQYSDDEDIASDKDINGKRKRKSRPSSAVNSRHTTPTPGKTPQKPETKTEKAATPRPVKKREAVLQKALKGKAARPRKAAQKKAERKEPTRRSMRKRQKTE